MLGSDGISDPMPFMGTPETAPLYDDTTAVRDDAKPLPGSLRKLLDAVPSLRARRVPSGRPGAVRFAALGPETLDGEAQQYSPNSTSSSRPDLGSTDTLFVDPTDPRNVYAATKVHQEHLCAAFARDWFTAGRLVWTSGGNAGLAGHVKSQPVAGPEAPRHVGQQRPVAAEQVDVVHAHGLKAGWVAATGGGAGWTALAALRRPPLATLQCRAGIRSVFSSSALAPCICMVVAVR